MSGSQAGGTNQTVRFHFAQHLSNDDRPIQAMGDFGMTPTYNDIEFPGGGVDG